MRACCLFFFFFLYIYKADLSIIHCLNIVRCIIVYLKYIIIIMKFQKKKKLSDSSSLSCVNRFGLSSLLLRIFCLDLVHISIDFVFAASIESLFPFSQLSNSFRSSLIAYSRLEMSLDM